MMHADDFELPRLEHRFTDKFGRGRVPAVFYAPGRVNLIGDHTDYTGGLVFPCGIDRGTYLLIRPTGNQRYRLASVNFDLMAELDPDELGHTYGDNWINYPLGVIDQFRRQGKEFEGFDCLYAGNVPNGAGLSSSASIEVVTALALNSLYNCGYDLIELVKIAQRAENDFVGMRCGIMDQFAVAMAKRDHALLLDCASLQYRHVPLQLRDHAIVVANTNQRRELNESAYNDRVNECARALSLLQSRLSITALGELEPSTLDANLDLFDDDPVALKRVTHIATENARVRAAVPTLENDDLAAFGELMNASHNSLRDAFEVSSEPLDVLVKLAREHQGVLGSRLTGAGFGGCTVNLVARNAVAAFERTVGARYQMITGLTADFYTTVPGDGVQQLQGN